MRKKIMWSLLGVVVAVLGVFGYYAYSFYSFADKISTSSENSTRFGGVMHQTVTQTGEKLTPPKWEGKERVNILLLGGDSRGLKDNEIPRSDSNMVVSLDPVTKKSYLFSILRDTYVKIPNSGWDRVNTAIATGGPELAMKTVSDLMGIPIQYYVYTDFKGFIALVDAVDGIDLEVEKDMRYSDSEDGHEYDINLKKGYQHLDGKTALQYVRFRHDASSDFTRTERQRKFMKALAEKLQSTTSLIKLPRILQSMDPYIETNLSVTEMLKLGALGFEVKTDGMVSQQIPPQDLLEEKRVGGAEVLGVTDPIKLKNFVKELFGETPDPTKTPGGKVSLGSDAGTSGLTPSKAPAASVKPSVNTPKPTVKPAVMTSAKPSSKPAASPKASLKPTPTPDLTPAKSPAATPKTGAGTGGADTGKTGDGGGGGTGGGTGKDGKAVPAATPKPSAKTAGTDH